MGGSHRRQHAVQGPGAALLVPAWVTTCILLCCMQTPEAGVGRGLWAGSGRRCLAQNTLDPGYLFTAIRSPSVLYVVEPQYKFVKTMDKRKQNH